MKSIKYIFILIFVISIQLNFKNVSAQWVPTGHLDNLDVSQVISVVDSNVVWVAGGNASPVIYKTINVGVNWLTVPVIGLPNQISGIAAKDESTAFVCDFGDDPSLGGNAKVFKTTNAGLNWILIDSTGGANGYFNGILFSKINQQFGVAFSDPPLGPGNPYFLLKTSNGGNNWVSESPPGIPDNYGLFHTVFVIDPLFYGIIALSASTTVINPYNTSNGGLNWNAGNTNLPISTYSDIVFSDNKQTGIMTISSGTHEVRRTTNGGNSWNLINTGTNLSGSSGAAWISGTNSVFICSYTTTSGNDNVIKSDDGGLSWISQSTGNTQGLIEIDYVRYNNTIVAYCISRTGDVIKTRQTVQLVGISQTGINIPEDIKLYQNYPNPFNPITNLEFGISELGFVSLKVYDLLGNEVSSLVNSELKPGIYNYQFDASGLSSGTYFYRLKINDHSETKSMILLK